LKHDRNADRIGLHVGPLLRPLHADRRPRRNRRSRVLLLDITGSSHLSAANGVWREGDRGRQLSYWPVSLLRMESARRAVARRRGIACLWTGL
jgi:hypothetical protein